FSSGAGRTSDGNGSHASTLKSPSYTKSVSWQHYLIVGMINRYKEWEIGQKRMNCTEKCAELSVKLCWKCAIWGRNQSILLSQAYYVQH
ncbi:transposase, partial [Shigella flexneri]